MMICHSNLEDAINESTGINPIDANGQDEYISDGQKTMIDSLLIQAIIPEERKQWIEKRINLLGYNEASDLIEELQEKQVNPVDSMGYGKKGILESLSKLK